MTDDQVANAPVTVCIAMSEGGTFLSAFTDTHWIQEERKHQDLLKRVREDKQLWSVKYIRTSIQYPVTTEKKRMTITNYTDLELKLQAEVAELKAEYIAYIGRTGARILALHEELGELKAKLAETERRYPKSALETHPMIPNSKCKCEHWQRCPECTPSLSAPNQRVIELYEKGLMKDFKGYHHEPRTN